MLLCSQVQLVELLLVYQAWSVCQQALSSLSFRKRDHVAYVVCSRQQHDKPVKPERQTAMRRCAVFQCLQEETKLVFGLFL